MNKQTENALRLAIEFTSPRAGGTRVLLASTVNKACKEALEQEDYEKRGLEFENEHLKKELDGAMMMLKEQPEQSACEECGMKYCECGERK